MTGITENTKVRSLRRSATYWLIVKRGAGQAKEERLTVDSDNGGKALAVFSFEAEADMFLSLSSLGAGWRLSRGHVRGTHRHAPGLLHGHPVCGPSTRYRS